MTKPRHYKYRVEINKLSTEKKALPPSPYLTPLRASSQPSHDADKDEEEGKPVQPDLTKSPTVLCEEASHRLLSCQTLSSKTARRISRSQQKGHELQLIQHKPEHNQEASATTFSCSLTRAAIV